VAADGRTVAIISPHLDDAVLGCWAEIARSPRAIVVNVCTAVPPGGWLAYWDGVCGGTDSAEHMRVRLAEDARALEFAGAERIDLGFLDKHYREGKPLDPEELGDRLAEALPPDALVLAPAGIGEHVDHLTARDVAIGLGGEREVSLYADLPYCVRYGWPGWVTGTEPDPHLDVEMTWAPALKGLGDGWSTEALRLSEEEQLAKHEAMRLYATQYPGLTGGAAVDWLSHPAILPFEVRWRRDGVATQPTETD
jgi:LmbE family N-acetylglucosaminyl deacetylase